MNLGKFVFAQVMKHLPLHAFHRCVVRYSGEYNCLDQYLCMAFAQLTYRESLRDIEACLRVQSSKLYHLGFRSPVARNTLANANATRDWRIYCDLAQSLIGTSPRLRQCSAVLKLRSSGASVGRTSLRPLPKRHRWYNRRYAKRCYRQHLVSERPPRN